MNVSEQQLVTKQFYKNFVDNEEMHPVEVLGEAYSKEQEKEIYDLSYIRFAQGEVYFHSKDYESAIFKWENIHNELSPWAKKNMADAYFKLGIYKNAEELYLSIEEKSTLLDTDIEFRLFQLYEQQQIFDKAEDHIKKAIFLDPDYPSVTEKARLFFEERENWKNAVELAVSEGMRTSSEEWFSHFIRYVEKKVIGDFEPRDFKDFIVHSSQMNQSLFEKLVTTLWKSYMDSDHFLQWIHMITNVFAKVEGEQFGGEMQSQFELSCARLMSGKYPFIEVESFLPNFLLVWFEHADSLRKNRAASALLAANDCMTTSFDEQILEDAKKFLQKEQIFDRNAVKLLYADIVNWANQRNIQLPEQGVFVSDDDEELDSESVLNRLKELLRQLVDKRTERIDYLNTTKHNSEQMLAKVTGALNQLNDKEQEMEKTLRKTFMEEKDYLFDELSSKIEKTIRDCSNLIKPDSNFATIQSDLNDQVHQKIEELFENQLFDKVNKSFYRWLDGAKEILEKNDQFIEEIREGFNALFEEERLTMKCDFQLLNDWHRDLERLTKIVKVEKFDLFDGMSPSQIYLKFSGKLLGNITKNKDWLSRQYKKWLETTDFSSLAEKITTDFLQPFLIIERSIDGDLQGFFHEPYEQLKEAEANLEKEIAEMKKELEELKTNPAVFHDRIKFFNIRLRQFEWMKWAKKDSIEVES